MFRRLCLFALLASSLHAAGVAGIWTGQLTEPNRDPQDFSFRFAEASGGVSGKMYGDNESNPLKDLKIEGDRITFTVTTELNGQVNKFTFRGIIRGNEIELTRERESSSKEKDEKPGPTLVLRRIA
ncbi:MAG TPA: hypothetical protein VKB79_25710 [Bryobacteraceae bacterium]|nr:hypothetical protein [Bryobacteraceae bacterium]